MPESESNQILLLREAVRQAEAYLEDQGKMAIAADQRAVTFASSVTAVAVALIAGLAFSLTSADIEYGFLISFMILFLVILLIFASWHAITSAKSVTFFYRGNEPICWKNDIDSNKNFNESMMEIIDYYQNNIDQNKKIIEVNSEYINRSFNIVKLFLFSCGVFIPIIFILEIRFWGD